jgi:hypothetical protein
LDHGHSPVTAPALTTSSRFSLSPWKDGSSKTVTLIPNLHTHSLCTTHGRTPQPPLSTVRPSHGRFPGIGMERSGHQTLSPIPSRSADAGHIHPGHHNNVCPASLMLHPACMADGICELAPRYRPPSLRPIFWHCKATKMVSWGCDITHMGRLLRRNPRT